MKDSPKNQAVQQGPPERPRASKTAGGAALGQEHGKEARRLAAAILEVLAGARTPADAAAAVGVSLPRYYQLETAALRGLLAACEPKPRGRQEGAGKAMDRLRQENQRLQREVGRQQALVRAAQRAVGLAPPPVKPAAKPARRRRVARALGVAARLRQEAGDGVASASSSVVL
jgi:hypothetical protein